MAIQIPNPGTGNGQTGDNEYVLWGKVKSNFENQTHAASRSIGFLGNEVPTGDFVFESFARRVANDTAYGTALDCNTLEAGSRVLIDGNAVNGPPTNGQGGSFGDTYVIETYSTRSTVNRYQLAYSYASYESKMYMRSFYNGWQSWRICTETSAAYQKTTAAGANVVVDTTGKFMRSTSSERYKDILADLELDDAAYENAMQLAPIVYRSMADADNPNYHYYSFSAEALGAFDPAFTLWRDTETVTDADGNTFEQPLAERVAEGININALLAFSHAIAIKQNKMIRTQAVAIATLTQRLDAMATQ